MSKSIRYRGLCIVLLFFCTGLQAQQRSIRSINSNWQFHKGDLKMGQADDAATAWQPVSLPHTWNVQDVMDDVPGYYRGPGWYRKTLYIDPSFRGKELYLYFEGANQVTEVWVNGKKAGAHTGGYTAFSFPVTALVRVGDSSTPNELLVKADNAHSEDIPPLSADFTFYGGLYRDVYLIAANPVHFDMDNNASPGVFIRTPFVSNAYATMEIKGAVTNHGAAAGEWIIDTKLLDAEGALVAQQQSGIRIAAGQNAPFEQSVRNIRHPRLWSPDDPYLYRVVTSIREKQSGRLLDERSQAWGFRWFQFDANRGFYLNGVPLKLMGANRHQDYKGLGNALPDALHVNDIRLLKAMGANFIRISHYPQDPAVLEACDRMGILASVEIPIVNRITESKAFADNCLHMQREMIRQNFNHPAVIIWAFMNEVLLVPRYTAGTPEREAYYHHVAALARRLDSLTRSEDSSRYTMIPNHGDFNLYTKAGITAIPMIVGWNLYQGWYSDSLPAFGKFLDRHHRELPDKPMIVTEFGADVLPALHSFHPERFDRTQEYANLYHQAYEQAIRKRAFVAGGAVWNLVDFNSEGREEASPHINSKGLLTTDRRPKDGYFFYQSKLLKQPYIRIGSSGWTHRAGIAVSDNQLYCVQPVDVYTNLPAITARLNGKSLPPARAVDGIARIDVPFRNGDNILEVAAPSGRDTLTDMTEIHFQLLPPTLANQLLSFTSLHVNLGDKRYYVDELTGEVWLPEQPYTPGGWGYIGGRPFVVKGSTRIPYGSGKNILGTDLDPLYQTQRMGIDSFRFDVPDGQYELTLHFCELLSQKERAALAYDLGAGAAGKDDFSGRLFSVSVNDIPVARLGTADYLVPEQAFSTKVQVSVSDGKGIVAVFHALNGESILNGIEVKKL